jgi:hypothetical protein
MDPQQPGIFDFDERLADAVFIDEPISPRLMGFFLLSDFRTERLCDVR